MFDVYSVEVIIYVCGGFLSLAILFQGLSQIRKAAEEELEDGEGSTPVQIGVPKMVLFGCFVAYWLCIWLSHYLLGPQNFDWTSEKYLVQTFQALMLVGGFLLCGRSLKSLPRFAWVAMIGLFLCAVHSIGSWLPNHFSDCWDASRQWRVEHKWPTNRGVVHLDEVSIRDEEDYKIFYYHVSWKGLDTTERDVLMIRFDKKVKGFTRWAPYASQKWLYAEWDEHKRITTLGAFSILSVDPPAKAN